MKVSLDTLNPKWMFPSLPVEPEVYNGDTSANGIIFDCPACKNHKIRVRFFNHPQLDAEKWEYTGNYFVDLTIKPSIDGTQDGVCKFHGFVTNGEVTW